MTTGHVFIATSVDGFVARKDHSIDWLTKQSSVEGEDGGFAAFMDSVDGLIMGSGSFRTILGLGQWPYTKPVIVLSSTLSERDVPDKLKDKARISRSTPKVIMQDLEREHWARAYVDGGRLVQSFLREGLISDLTVTSIPILIGEGIPLFGSLDADVDLELVSFRKLRTGMLQSSYRIV